MASSSKPISRRTLLQGGVALASALSALTLSGAPLNASKRHNRIHQSVSRWCYKDVPLDKLCTAAPSIGLKGIDLLEVAEFEVPARYGLVCTMGYAGGGEINTGGAVASRDARDC